MQTQRLRFNLHPVAIVTEWDGFLIDEREARFRTPITVLLPLSVSSGARP